MNKLFQKIAAGMGLMVSLGLLSCQNDNLVVPDQPTAGAARTSAVGTISPQSNKRYKLITHGDSTLKYGEDGRLQQVYAYMRTSQYVHTDYTYGNGWARAISYKGAVVLKDETFSLDAYGRCYESAVTGHFLNKGVYQAYQTGWTFSYYDTGQLRARYSKTNCTLTTEYVYDADGDVKKATTYYGSETFFAYTGLNCGPIEADRYPLNMYGVNEHDAYLPIFGNPSKHLLKRVSHGASAQPEQYYTYSLDAAGYVQTNQYTNSPGGTPLKTTLYGYLITDPTAPM